MADSIWGTGRRLDASLFSSAYEFEFFQAVRLLLLMERERNPQLRGAKLDDAARFAVHNSMNFPPSPVVSIDAGKHELPPKMTVAFVGLIGPLGMLPQNYTESAVHQKAFGDPSFAAFFDIFHHRLLSLFYRAWEKHRWIIGYEQAGKNTSTRDALTRYLLDLIGMGTPGLQQRLPFSDQALLRYAGLLSQRPRSAEVLRALLHDFFGMSVHIEQFLGRWHTLDHDELCVLGEEAPSSQLGEGTVAGDMVWSRQAIIRIVFGPLSAYEFFQFLPDGKIFKVASVLIRWFLGPMTDFELQPVLARGQTPGWCRLGESRSAARLGWSHWLTDEPFAHPASDAIFAESEGVSMEA